MLKHSILAEARGGVPRWLTTLDAARMLEVTVDGVRWLERTGHLRCERTRAGQRLFRAADVQSLMDKRAQTRCIGHVPPRSVALGEPRQLALFGKARLQLVEGERVLRVPVAKGSGSFRKVVGA